MNRAAALILGAFAGACRGPICDSCVPSSKISLEVLPHGTNVRIAASGAACAGETPRLEGDRFTVSIVAGGTCHLDAVFPDGAQHRFDYLVVDARGDDCCHAFTAPNGDQQCARAGDAGIDNHRCGLF